MIRHLRWKVVATNMLLISLVLLAVFAAVYFISRGNYHKNVQQQLYQALEQGDYGRSQPGMDSIPCFVAEVYGSGTVRVAGNSYYDLSDETRMAEIVTAALAVDEDAGTLDEVHLRYLRQRQRVADEVGHILDLAPLIVVAEHHGILLLFQTLYLFFQIGSCCYGLVDKPVINIHFIFSYKVEFFIKIKSLSPIII